MTYLHRCPWCLYFYSTNSFFKSAKNETTVACCGFSPIQSPSYASGSRRPVTLFTDSLMLPPILTSDDGQLFHNNSVSTSLQEYDALDGTAPMSVLLKCHLAEAVGSPLSVPVSCLLSQNRNILVPEVDMWCLLAQTNKRHTSKTPIITEILSVWMKDIFFWVDSCWESITSVLMHILECITVIETPIFFF